MKLGVLQGRLSKPVDGMYQEFPRYWRNEFDVLSQLGLTGVEWLITPLCEEDNPFMKRNAISELPIMSVCIDTLVSDLICSEDFLLEKLSPVCAYAVKNGVKILTIPILDESDLNDDVRRSKFCSIIKEYGENYPKLKFAFEAEMSPEKLDEIVSLSDNFYVTYDTGNITSCGVDHEHFIRYFRDKIINVHIKDRTYDRRTVSHPRS